MARTTSNFRRKPPGPRLQLFQAPKTLTPEATASIPIASKKHPLPTSPPSQPAKRLKQTALNTPPTTKLNIYVCGDGESGELGLGHTVIDGKKPTGVKRPRLNPLLPASTVGVVQIAAGGMHCVALTHDQQILTWGVNDDGALGRETAWEAPMRDADAVSDEGSEDEGDLNPKESTPTAIPREAFDNVPGLFVQVVALDSASFALTSTGSVYGWGTFRANDGILGFAASTALSSSKSKKFQRTPTLLPSLTKITSLAAGNNHILALSATGHVFTWGTPEQSQLGRRLPRSRITALTPSPVALPPITKIACGAYHSFALTSSGDVIRDIAGGEHHSLACTSDGRVLIWGRCDDNQAGLNLSALPAQSLVFDAHGRPRILAPTLIPGLGSVMAVAAGIDNSFAVTQQGTANAWGYSENYRTGLGTVETPETPVLVAEGKVISVAACGGQFSVLAGPGGSI
ncbi:hypothetical protein V492_05276 [Pseudogymnoascus sp. VKM F-4246]|nr:hypothetical protein V492_05276 [Pseudogymnoascus sp. VKM F-4246]